MRSRRETRTEQLEMVETYNLYLCLRRLRDAPGYHAERWKRALYHALAQSNIALDPALTKIREALELP